MAQPAVDAAAPLEHAPDLRRDLPAVGAMGFLFLLSIGLAMRFSSTFFEQNLRAFEDPDNVWNPLIYLGIVVAFTALILLIAKFGRRALIRYIILGSVLLTIAYVLGPLLDTLPGLDAPVGPMSLGGALGLAVALGLTALLHRFPEWYVIDVVGVLVAAGAAGIFGISFGLLPSLLLLVGFAVYDAIAVYRTKHMLDLADSVLELRLPIMFVVPKSRGYSFLQETRKVKEPGPDDAPGKREAMFMGLGDAVIPGILVVSALTFLDPLVTVGTLGGPLVVALSTLAGSLVGFGVLMGFVLKGNAHAGLPLLNGGAIAGFLLALVPLYGLVPLNPFA